MKLERGEDIDAINYAVCSGVKGIFTAHGADLEEININPVISSLIKKYVFERIIFLDSKEKGKIERVYGLDRKNKEYLEIS